MILRQWELISAEEDDTKGMHLKKSSVMVLCPTDVIFPSMTRAVVIDTLPFFVGPAEIDRLDFYVYACRRIRYSLDQDNNVRL